MLIFVSGLCKFFNFEFLTNNFKGKNWRKGRKTAEDIGTKYIKFIKTSVSCSYLKLSNEN